MPIIGKIFVDLGNSNTYSMKSRQRQQNRHAALYHLPAYLIVFSLLGCGAGESRLQSETTGEGVAITEDGSQILFYQVKPKSLDGLFERAGYVHPLYSLDGTVITEDFPEDHPHHHGIFSAWHQILLNDSMIADGWTSENISWEVTETKTERVEKGIVLDSEVLWKTPDGGTSKPIVSEHITITVHESTGQRRVIDYDFSLTALVDHVRIGGSADNKGYGGFSLRLKLPENINFAARDGDVEPQIEQLAVGPWMNMTGSFDGTAEKSGVLVFSHPSNPGHPQPWILRKQKSMQNAAFPGKTPVDIGKDGLHFRYRVVLHRDAPGRDAIEATYEEYAKD